jgi:anti-anti-sigma factor
MPIVLDQQEALSLIHLQGEIDIGSAIELKRLLLQAAARGKDLSIDLEDAAELDLTAWQLLLAASEGIMRSGLQFALIGQRQDSVATTLQDVGLAFNAAQ